MARDYMLRINVEGYDSGWYQFDYGRDMGAFIESVMPTFSGEVTFTIKEVDGKKEDQNEEEDQ